MLEWLQTLLSHHGYWVIFLVAFLNNLGLPVPGDMMVLGGGFLAHGGILSFGPVVITGAAACFLGGSCGYGLGRRYGRRLVKNIRWFRLHPGRMEQIEGFFGRYGAKVVFFARFVALLHPVTGLLAGMWRTPVRPFLFYNLAGSSAFAILYALAGYFLGQRWAHLMAWIGPTTLYLVLIAAGMGILGWFLRRAIRDFFTPPRPETRRARVHVAGKRKRG